MRNAISFERVSTTASAVDHPARYVQDGACATSRTCSDHACRGLDAASRRLVNSARTLAAPSSTPHTPSKFVRRASGTICLPLLPLAELDRINEANESAARRRRHGFAAKPDLLAHTLSSNGATARWHDRWVTVRSTVLSTLPLTGPRPSWSCPKGVKQCVHTS